MEPTLLLFQLASQGTSLICLKIQTKAEGKIRCYAKVVFYEQSKLLAERGSKRFVIDS
jgi:hypothetical protein